MPITTTCAWFEDILVSRLDTGSLAASNDLRCMANPNLQALDLVFASRPTACDRRATTSGGGAMVVEKLEIGVRPQRFGGASSSLRQRPKGGASDEASARNRRIAREMSTARSSSLSTPNRSGRNVFRKMRRASRGKRFASGSGQRCARFGAGRVAALARCAASINRCLRVALRHSSASFERSSSRASSATSE